MTLYRAGDFEELVNVMCGYIINTWGKFKEVGQGTMNTFTYEKDKKYMHFFLSLEDLSKADVILQKEAYVFEYTIPDKYIYGNIGKGFYGAREILEVRIEKKYINFSKFLKNVYTFGNWRKKLHSAQVNSKNIEEIFTTNMNFVENHFNVLDTIIDNMSLSLRSLEYKSYIYKTFDFNDSLKLHKDLLAYCKHINKKIKLFNALKSKDLFESIYVDIELLSQFEIFTTTDEYEREYKARNFEDGSFIEKAIHDLKYFELDNGTGHIDVTSKDFEASCYIRFISANEKMQNPNYAILTNDILLFPKIVKEYYSNLYKEIIESLADIEKQKSLTL